MASRVLTWMRMSTMAMLAVVSSMTVHAATFEEGDSSLDIEGVVALREASRDLAGGPSDVSPSASSWKGGEPADDAGHCFERYVICMRGAVDSSTPTQRLSRTIGCLLALISCVTEHLGPGLGSVEERDGSGLTTS